MDVDQKLIPVPSCRVPFLSRNNRLNKDLSSYIQHTDIEAHILAMAPMLLVTVTSVALARSSGRASLRRSGRTM